MLKWDNGEPFEVSVGEWIALVSGSYIFAVASFNAGYFSDVPGNYIILFSLTDLLSSNLSVLQFIFGVFTFACTLWLATQWFIKPLWRKHKEKVEKELALQYRDTVLFYASFGFIFGLFILSRAILRYFPGAPLAVQLAPYALFQIACIYQAWAAYKSELITLKGVCFAIFVALFVFSYQAGREWLSHELLDQTSIVTLQHSNGTCLERKVLRASSSGLLLYSAALKTFEYRDRSEIKAVYLSKQCL